MLKSNSLRRCNVTQLQSYNNWYELQSQFRWHDSVKSIENYTLNAKSYIQLQYALSTIQCRCGKWNIPKRIALRERLYRDPVVKWAAHSARARSRGGGRGTRGLANDDGLIARDESRDGVKMGYIDKTKLLFFLNSYTRSIGNIMLIIKWSIRRFLTSWCEVWASEK